MGGRGCIGRRAARRIGWHLGRRSGRCRLGQPAVDRGLAGLRRRIGGGLRRSARAVRRLAVPLLPVRAGLAARTVLGRDEDRGDRPHTVLVHRPPVGGVDQPADRLTVDGLLVEEGTGRRVEAAAVAGEHLERALLLGTQDQLDLVVDDLAGVLGVVPRCA